MAESLECKDCGKSFASPEALQMHSQAKHSKPSNEKASAKAKSKAFGRIAKYAVAVVVIVLIAYGLLSLASNEKVLPPTDLEGHVEESPQSHVLKEPMDILVQKHMLEHADGSGLPGVVINYNCIEFSCETGLVGKLEAFASKYSHVYVAPFAKMSVKIALTRHGKIETMDSFDEAKIEAFIRAG